MPKVTPACQDFKVLLVFQDLRVSTVGPVAQVSLVHPVDQESQADQEDQGCQERRVRQVGMGSQDQQESKESQDFQVTVVPVHLGFQGCLVQREIQVFPAQVAVLVSLALKEMPVSLVLLVLLAASALLGPQDQHFKAPKDSKGPLVHLEEQVHLAQRVPVDPKEVVE